MPGSPEWDLRDDLAARAMRLIADGVVEREGVPGLAARLGYTPRHLTRVLTAELGAGPLALARAHRAQTARALLASTSLPAADVAFASGFGSIRQFNDTIRAVYERSPLELRAAAKVARASAAVAPDPGSHGPTAAAEAGVVQLRLPARAPFDAGGRLRVARRARARRRRRRLDRPVRRTLRLPGGPAVVTLRPGDDATPSIDVDARLATLADLPPLVARVRRLFDLDADALAIDAALAADPALAPSVAATPGIRLPGCLDPHELVFRALIGQQVSVKAARTALQRLAAALGEHVAPLSGRPVDDAAEVAPSVLFPTAAALAHHGEQVLRGPAARIRTIVDVARRLDSGDLVVAPERERGELRDDLLAIPGIGPWTADYVAMRVTRAPDVLLTGDLALRNGAERLGLPASPAALAQRGARWAPWRSYASMHLWRAASERSDVSPDSR